MNTLVAFSTITALAVAVPTLSVKQLEGSLLQDKNIAKRNHESFHSELKTPGMGFVSESNENQERTFLKKKLLLKKLKKFRDNEEEAKSKTQEKNMPKSDGPQCIKYNSEDWGVNDFDIALRVVTTAIERLEGVINKQEEKKKISASKTEKSRNAENESEVELDKTVEEAKEALEQIRSDIVNLEELHLRTASFNSPSSAHESLKEEERLAQWKEVMEKIHRNVEIARNLEDNFKSKGQSSGPMEARSDVTDPKLKIQFASDDNKMKSEKNQEKSNWHHDEFKTDMKAAVEGAKEPAPMKNNKHMHIKTCGVHDKAFVGPQKHRKHSAPAQNSAGTKEKKSNELNSPKNNSDENKSDSSSQESEKLEQQMINNKENPLKGDETNKTGSPLHKENEPMEAMGHNKTKSDLDIDLGENNQEDLKKVESDSHVAASNQIAHVLKPETKAESGMQNVNKSMVAKPENNQPSESQMNSKSQQVGQSRFSQQDPMRLNDQLHESHWHEEHGPSFNSFMKASDEHNRRFHPMKQNINHESPMGSNGMMPGRSAEMANVMSNMRSAPVHNRWQDLHRSRGAYGPSLGYGTPQPSSGSASSGSATTSGGSGSGSVGVFSNAKIGDCGIPLLLSCSPSVVTGTLSETSSYSKPAYRAESKRFSFHDKRDTKKVNRSPSPEERQE